jgi:ABC-type nitrate/sulfonate/bicarbonate transport system permease component
MAADIFVIGLIGYLLFELIRKVERLAIPWHVQERA